MDIKEVSYACSPCAFSAWLNCLATMPHQSLHPYQKLILRHDSPFELKPSDGKGWGAFATRNIQGGNEVFREDAIFVFNEGDDLDAKFAGLSEHQREQLALLLDPNHQPFTSNRGLVGCNDFGLKSTIPAERGLFPLSSRFNHSCLPNAEFRLELASERSTVVTLAKQDIPKDAEITFCYAPYIDFCTVAERTAIPTSDPSLNVLPFPCTCAACTSSRPGSDIRRILMRGLKFLKTGHDTEAHRRRLKNGNFVERNIIKDRDKRVAAKYGDGITPEGRVMFQLVSLYLGKAEGLYNRGYIIHKLNQWTFRVPLQDDHRLLAEVQRILRLPDSLSRAASALSKLSQIWVTIDDRGHPFSEQETRHLLETLHDTESARELAQMLNIHLLAARRWEALHVRLLNSVSINMGSGKILLRSSSAHQPSKLDS